MDIPNVDITKVNRDDKFAFQKALKTIQSFIENPTNYEPLRMIVSGTAGSGTFYLIKCLAKAIRNFFHQIELLKYFVQLVTVHILFLE